MSNKGPKENQADIRIDPEDVAAINDAVAKIAELKESPEFKEFIEILEKWQALKEKAMDIYGLSEDELDGILSDKPALQIMDEISLAEFVEQSTTNEERLLAGGLLDLILRKSRQEGRPAAEVIQDIRDALESGEPPRATIKKTDAVDYPLDKINANVWNLLEEDTGGQLTFSAEKRGSKHQLDIIYSIDFDALENTGIAISKRLLPFDKRVYIVVAALWRAGNEIITLTQIHYAMGNKGSRPSDNQLQRIRSSVIKMLSARITLDNTSEAETYSRYGRFVYNGMLLPVEFVDYYNIQGSLTDSAIHIFREPPLISFSRQRKQITPIEIKLLQSPLSKTDIHLAIDDYLIERIARIKHNNDHGKGKLLYKTIYDHVNAGDRKQRQRLPGTVERYLSHYQACGFISGYKTEKDGVTIFY